MRLAQLLPAFIKRPITAHIRTIAEIYLSSHPGEDAYCVKPKAPTAERPESGKLPIPPKELWVGYGPDAQQYISGGKRDVTDMVRILGEKGFSVGGAKRILEFGCGAGRMIRHLPDVAPIAQLWGVDLSAQHIRWCVDNLTPTIHFATTTLVPHLPFEDRFFDFIFCGSVFTHIEDIQESWLLELGRVLRPSGKLYFTIHDEHTVKLLDTRCRDSLLAKSMRETSLYNCSKGNFNMIVISRGSLSQVFYNSRYVEHIIPPVFKWISLTPEAYGYQSAVILDRR